MITMDGKTGQGFPHRMAPGTSEDSTSQLEGNIDQIWSVTEQKNRIKISESTMDLVSIVYRHYKNKINEELFKKKEGRLS